MPTSKKFKGVLIDTKKGISKVTLEAPDVSKIQELLGCKYMSCTRRIIKGERFAVYYDAEFMTAQALEPAFITRGKETRRLMEVIYGNCFVCKDDKKQNPETLTYKEINIVLSAEGTITKDGKTYKIVQSEI